MITYNLFLFLVFFLQTINKLPKHLRGFSFQFVGFLVNLLSRGFPSCPSTCMHACRNVDGSSVTTPNGTTTTSTDAHGGRHWRRRSTAYIAWIFHNLILLKNLFRKQIPEKTYLRNGSFWGTRVAGASGAILLPTWRGGDEVAGGGRQCGWRRPPPPALQFFPLC